MVTTGWVAALAGFVIGALVGWFLARRRPTDAWAPAEHSDAIESLAEEIKLAKALLQAEDDDAEAAAKSIAELDEAIKRANGRLKLIAKSVRKSR